MSKIEKELQLLNFIHSLNNRLSNYNSDDDITNTIHSNLDKMDTEEMKYFISKILSYNQLKMILLDYDLAEYKMTPKELNLEDFTKIAIETLNRYETLNNSLEDSWTVIRNTDDSPEYNVKKGELLFENTLYKKNEYDVQTIDYLEKITDRLNMISTKIKAEFKVCKNKDDVCLVNIWCSERKS